MSETLAVTCPANVWTLVTESSDNVLLVGPPSGYEVFLGAAAPDAETPGLPVTAPGGGLSLSAMGGADNLYARPFGAFANVELVLKLIKS